MINNYLTWVKRRRKYCVDCAIRDARISRRATNDWAKGFHKGLSMANDFSGQNFKQLQKSLEEQLEYACTHSSPEVWQRFSQSLLS